MKRNRMKGQTMLIDDLRRLVVQKGELEKQLFEAMKSFAPIGSHRVFKRGGNLVTAQILDHAGPGYPRCKIENLKTEKSYWVDLHDFITD